MTVKILKGDCREILRTLPAESVHCVVTSPPYWGLRDYSVPASIWGGDDACQHEWGEHAISRKGSTNGRGDLGSTLVSVDAPKTLAPGLANDQIGTAQYRTDRSAFCVHCNAWRGAHGLEPDYNLFVENEVLIFRDVRRVLRSDGTLWLNLGDSYATGAGKVGDHPGGGAQGAAWTGRHALGANSQLANRKVARLDGNRGLHTPANSGKHGPRIDAMGPMTQPNRMPQPGLKAKDLCGIPWRVAFALQADGWYLRQDIIWSKPNPMPESVRDRCTKAHEYLFLLSKSERYYYDADAIAEPVTQTTIDRLSQPTINEQYGSDRVPGKTNGPMKAVGKLRLSDSTNESFVPGSTPHSGLHRAGTPRVGNSRKELRSDIESRHRSSIPGGQSMQADPTGTRNRRSVWTVTTQPFSDAHFATFPPALIEPCILAGCPKGGTVLDCFGGAGTTGMVADRLGRNAILIELNPAYAAMAERRIRGDAGMFAAVETA